MRGGDKKRLGEYVSGFYEITLLQGCHLACSRLSASEDSPKTERATSGISGEWDSGEKRRGREGL